jgi:hypothetical protein
MTQSRSLREYDDPVDRIRLHRQVSNNPIVVLEGQSDKRFYQRLFPDIAVDYFPVGTRATVLKVAQGVHFNGCKRVVCAVDRDFDSVVSEHESRLPNVIAYDNADLEAMLIDSKTFDDFIEEVASADKLSSYGGVSAVRNHIRNESRLVARIRYSNASSGWGLSFDKVDIVAKSKVADGRVLIASVCNALLADRDDNSLRHEDLLVIARGDDTYCPHSGNALFRGRDALTILGVLLRRLIGSLKHGDASSGEHLARSLRLATRREYVEGLAWWSRLVAELELGE